MQYFKEVLEYLRKNELKPPVGSEADEIVALQKALGEEMPKAYVEYLELMGQDYDGVMVGTNCFLSDVESNNRYLPELLEANGLASYKLPKKYLVFFCHQGYMAAWFSLPSKSDDPTCTYYFEGTTETPEKYGAFSEFMKKDILGNAKLTVENRRHEKNRRRWWQFWK
jgi:SMI1-KNR4 cell-wall